MNTPALTGTTAGNVESARSRANMSAARRLAVCVLACGAALALPGSGGVASARDEQILYGICDFPITHEFPKFRIAHAAPVPTTHAPFEGFDTGQVKVVVTNMLNGESVTLNASSAVFHQWDGTVLFRGSSVAFFDTARGDIPAGVWLVVGSVRTTLDEEGRIATATGGVLRRDICAELA